MASRELAPEEVEFAVVDGERARVARMVEAIQRTVALHGPRIAQEEVDKADPKPVDVGTYRRSFDAYDTPLGAVFLNTSAHGSIVERGRRPGRWPPREAIERWVRRKFRLRLSEMSRRGGREAQVRSIAFAVARKIARVGIPGKHVLARTEKRLTPIVAEAVRRAAAGSTP